jgi:hypothetical protein
VEVSDRGKLSGYDRGMVKVRLGINPIVTLEKQLLNMIGNLV